MSTLRSKVLRYARSHGMPSTLANDITSVEQFTSFKSTQAFNTRLSKFTTAHPLATGAELQQFLPHGVLSDDRDQRFRQLQNHVRGLEKKSLVSQARAWGVRATTRASITNLNRAISAARTQHHETQAQQHESDISNLPTQTTKTRSAEHKRRGAEAFEHIRGITNLPTASPTGRSKVHVERLGSSVNGYVVEYRFTTEREYRDIQPFVAAIRGKMFESIRQYMLDVHRGVKFVPSLLLTLERGDGVDKQTIEQPLATKAKTAYHPTDITREIATIAADIDGKLDVFTQRGSGWRLVRVVSAAVQLNPLSPKSGRSYIDLPEWVRNKQACINVQNNDDKCFLWSVLAALHPQKKDPQRVSKYKPFENSLSLHGINFPMRIDQITQFEKQNPTIAIQVLGIDSDEDGTPSKNFYPMHQTQNHQAEHKIMLLLHTNETGGSHYVLVKDFNRLVGCRSNNQTFNCFHCFGNFSTAEALENHRQFNCIDSNCCREVLPKKLFVQYSDLDYVNGKNPTLINQRNPFCIYADYESMLQPLAHEPLSESNPTIHTEKHIPIAACVKVVCADSEKSLPTEVFHGTDCTATMLEYLRTDVRSHITKTIQEGLKKLFTFAQCLADPSIIRINGMTGEDFHRCGKQFIDHGCLVCCKNKAGEKDATAEEFTEERCAAVFDICPFTNKLYGLGHRQCIRDYRMRQTIPVVFHNLSGYDSHLLLRDLTAKEFEDQDWNSRVSILPCNEEKVLTFSIGQFRFIDSWRFLNRSLDELVSMQKKSGNTFPAVHSEFGDKSHWLTQKGCFPYEWLQNEERLEQTSLPARDEFYSKLRGESITEAEYQHAQNVWQQFHCKTMRDYLELYIKSDVLLLADVFEYYRTQSLSSCGLDPSHFVSLPGFAQKTMMKMTEARLELLPNADMYRWVERGLRGGMVVASHRHATASELGLSPTRAEHKDHIGYYDATNLYGKAMTQILPQGDFKWATKEFLAKWDTKDKILRMTDDAPRGAFFEVDIDIPESLHDHFSDYPLLPENRFVDAKELSPKQRELAGEDATKAKTRKLVSDLLPKRNYVVHYRMLKFALLQGCELKKVHRMLHFKQSAWLAPYINWCTENRKTLGKSSAFQKDLWKLMANAVFGKQMESVRDRIQIRMAHDKESLLRCTSDSRFRSSIAFNDEIAGCVMRTSVAVLKSPIAVGAAILDLSKLHMFKFHYETIKPTFGDRAKLCYTDTDSLVYRFQNFSDEDMKNLAPHMDMSTMVPEGHPLYSEDNSGVLGKFKDECPGNRIVSFVALRSKMYSYRCEKDGGDRRAKGISKQTTKRELTHDKYERCVTGEKIGRVRQVRIGSTKHQLYTIAEYKQSLDAFDSKRWLCEDGITTLPYGHHRTKEPGASLGQVFDLP